MAKFCGQCGMRMDDTDVFCQNCGSRSSGTITPPPTPPHRRNNKSVLSDVLIIVLSLMLVINGTIAGIWYPGFFTVHTEKDGSASDSSVKDNTSQADHSQENRTGTFSDIKINYTDSERASAPALEMKISADNPKASAEGFGVDFGEFNYIGDDTFTIKSLPVHTEKDAGYSVQGYDISLASGKDEFLGEVAVTIPRGEKDGDLVTFITKDPETGGNVEEYFELSEDGKSYILYTTHFSDHVKVQECDFTGDKFVEDVKKGNVTSSSTRKALSSFYYTKYYNVSGKWMNIPVAFSPYDLWAKLTEGDSYLPSSYSLMAAVADKINSSPEGELPEKIDLCGVLLYDQQEMEKSFGDQWGTAGFINDVKTAGVDQGAAALDRLSLEKVSTGLKNIVHEHADSLSKSKGSGVFDFLSVITTVAGFEVTNRKAVRELEAGKYSSEAQALWGNWEGYTGTILSVTGMIGSYVAGAAAAGTTLATGGAVVAVGAAVGGICLYCYSMSQDKPAYDDLTGAERNYREYYINGGIPRRFYYDMPEMAGKTYGEGATGNIRKLPESVLSEKQNQKLKSMINEGMKKFNVTGGIAAEDTRDKTIMADWFGAAAIIYNILTEDGQPEKIPDAVKAFYHNYASACWDLSDEDFISFSKEAMEARGEAPENARLPRFDTKKNGVDPSEEVYTELLEKELFTDHQKLFLTIARQTEHKALLETNKMIREELVPLLNTDIEFRVEDLSLEDPKNFTESVYSDQPKFKDKVYEYELPDFEGSFRTDRRYSYDHALEFRIKQENGDYKRIGPPVFLPSFNVSDYVEDYGTIVVGLNLMKCRSYEFYPVTDSFEPYLRNKSDGNLVFRCNYFYWLMMGAPTAMAFRNIRKEKSETRIIDFEMPEKPDSDGIMRVNIAIEGEKETQPESTLTMQLKSDSSCLYSPGRYDAQLFKEKSAIPNGSTLTINKDGSITVSVQEIDAKWVDEYSSNNKSGTDTVTFKRASFTCTAQPVFTSYDNGVLINRKYVVTQCPSISGTENFVNDILWYPGMNIEREEHHTTITTNSISDPALVTPAKGETFKTDNEIYKKYPHVSTVNVVYDDSGTKITSVSLTISGTRVEDRKSDKLGDYTEKHENDALSFVLKPVS